MTHPDPAVEKAIRDVVAAWTVEGPSPLYHRSWMKELKMGWPALHRAAVALVAADRRAKALSA